MIFSARAHIFPAAMNTHLHTLHHEKIICWRDLARRWERQECEYRELEAKAAVDVVWALLVGMEKKG